MSLALTPLVWMSHFLAVYIWVSLACPAGLESLVRPVIGAATLGALAFYAWFGLASGRMADGRTRGNESETPALIGTVNRLLCALSAIATIWVALPAFMLAPCAG